MRTRDRVHQHDNQLSRKNILNLIRAFGRKQITAQAMIVKDYYEEFKNRYELACKNADAIMAVTKQVTEEVLRTGLSLTGRVHSLGEVIERDTGFA